MKHKLIILITLLSVSMYAKAQEYRLAKSSGQLKLYISGVIVEGYDGKDIIFSGQKVVIEESSSDERAKGLVPISSSRYNDNTGLGINVTESGQDINVNLVAKKPIGILTIKVPNTIKVSILTNSSNNGLFYSFNTTSDNNNTNKPADQIVLKNLKSEIEVSVYNNNIRLENNSGPMNIKTVSGSVDAIFSGEVKGPVSIISVTNYVDVTLPASTKANIEMSSNSGKLYAGKEFKIDIDKDAVFEENLISVGTRATNRLPGLRTIKTDNATAVSGVQINGAGSLSKKAGSSAKTEEIVVTGYPTSATVKGVEVKTAGTSNKKSGSTKSNAEEIVVTGYPAATTVTGVQINGNGNFSSNSIIVDNDYPASMRYAIGSIYSRGDRIKGKLNGGGIDLIFKSTNKNVYLRQP